MSTEKVIVGKLSMLQTQGQISLFVLPRSFDWLKTLTAEEIGEFFAELLEALGQSEQERDWTALSDLIEEWKATAEIAADPAVSAEIDRGLEELTDLKGVSWEELKQDLEL